MVGVLLTGTFLCVKQEAIRLIAQGQGGSIINVASINAIQPAEGLGAYCSAKAGVAMLTKMAALELGRHRIRVNGIGPGVTRTPLTAPHLGIPGSRMGSSPAPIGHIASQDIAAAVYLASDESCYDQQIIYTMEAPLKKVPSSSASFRLAHV
jgi:NAD(P)-dependent dehydrogenase (short-subunit alcohol dehydrogenase family)